MKEILQDKLLVRRLVIIMGYMLITAAITPFYKKLHGLFLDYTMITSITILAALSGIIQDYVKGYFSSVTVRNGILVTDFINLMIVGTIYIKFVHEDPERVASTIQGTDLKLLVTLIILASVNMAVQSVMTGMLGTRMKGYIGKVYGNRYEALDYKEKKLTSLAGIFGLVVFGLFYKTLGAGATLTIGGLLTIASNIYDVMNTKALRELDRIRNEKR